VRGGMVVGTTAWDVLVFGLGQKNNNAQCVMGIRQSLQILQKSCNFFFQVGPISNSGLMPRYPRKSLVFPTQQTFPCPVQGCRTQVRSHWGFKFTQHVGAKHPGMDLQMPVKAKFNFLLQIVFTRPAPLHRLQMPFLKMNPTSTMTSKFPTQVPTHLFGLRLPLWSVRACRLRF